VKRVARWVTVAGWLVACGGKPGDAGNDDADLQVIPITAHQWAFAPAEIHLSVNEPVILELTSADVHHGFNLPDFGVRADVIPGQKARVKVTPDKTGTFAFFCDYFCGTGHEGMQGQVVVE
jgi:cytochrome c oxidase subunit 2